MLFHAMMEFCLDLLRSKFWLIGEWSIEWFEMTSHTNQSQLIKVRWINFDPVLELDQYTSPSIQYYHVSKIKQYGWLIYSWIINEFGMHSSQTTLQGASKTDKGPFIIYTRGWYRRDMGWVIKFSTSSWVG
jgi:hypothetical protein